MSKRRDKKGRILRNGESQRADGRYAYVYTTSRGKQRFLYSWKLEPTDSLPAGRRKCISLREKEKELMRDLEDGIIPYGGELTVLKLVQMYIQQKTGVRHSTKAGYKTVVNDSVTREAITKKQERMLLEFIKNDKHFCKYYDGIYILFKTGLRISEFVGLTMKDLDFEERTINVDHQLQRGSDMVYIIEDTKTTNGTRVLPMTDDVYECFQRIISQRKRPKKEPEVDGLSGFLYLDKNDMPMVALHWEKYFQHITTKYNSIYKEELPKVTPHVCRHTYCSNMAKAGMNPKTLQYLMGHADIGVTLNTYTHIGLDDAKEELERVEKLKQAKSEVEQAIS